MKQHCHLHPTEPAQWSCNKCSSVYCSGCIQAREMGGYAPGRKMYMCPKCNLPAEWMGVGDLIDPFWKRLHLFFRYPLQVRPLILILVVAGLQLFFLGLGLLNTLLQIALWSITIKYSYECLKSTARGNLEPPPINQQTMSDDFQIVFKQYIIYFILGFAFMLVTIVLTPLVGIPFLILAVLLLPSMIILLVTTNSIIHALNPVLFTNMALRIGRGYLLMYFFLILLFFAPSAAIEYVATKIAPSAFLMYVSLVVKNYYAIVFYHLMGYVILQYHREIGYELDIDDIKLPGFKKPEEHAAAAAGILMRINPLIRDGKYAEALDLLGKQATAAERNDPAVAEKYYTLLKMTGEKEQAAKQGSVYIDLLAKNNKKEEVFRIYKECSASGQPFVPTAYTLFKMGEWLSASGKTKEAITLFGSLVKKHPSDPLVPKAYFRSAQIFNERLMNPEKAKKLLNGLIKKYPGHEIAGQAQRYMDTIT